MKNSKGTIAFVTANLLSRHSADIVYIMEMCNALAKAGYDTTLCVPKPDKAREGLFEYYGVEFPFRLMEVRLPGPLQKGTLPGRSLAFSLLVSWKLAMSGRYGIYVREAWVFFLITVVFRQRCVFEAHQFRFGKLRTFIYHALVKYGMLSGRGKMVCISQALMDQWRAFGIDAGRMRVAHDAVNINKFSAAIGKESARKALGLEPEGPIVAYTGSLIPGKGVEVLVNCANRLPDIRFVIAGGKPEQVAKLRLLAKGENVLFAGHVSPDKVPLYQAAADVLVLPNVQGSVIDDVTSPMKLFEYIASGRPIAASDMPSLLEILTNGHNALISPAGDDRRLAENIMTLVENTPLAEKLVRNATDDLEKYTWDARVRDLAKFLEFISVERTRPQISGV